MARMTLEDKNLRRVTHTPIYNFGFGRVGRTHAVRGVFKARYGERNKSWRIAYVQNRGWQLEVFQGILPDVWNTKLKVFVAIDRRTYSSWVPYSRPTDIDTALIQLSRRDVEAKSAA